MTMSAAMAVSSDASASPVGPVTMPVSGSVAAVSAVTTQVELQFAIELALAGTAGLSSLAALLAAAAANADSAAAASATLDAGGSSAVAAAAAVAPSITLTTQQLVDLIAVGAVVAVGRRDSADAAILDAASSIAFSSEPAPLVLYLDLSADAALNLANSLNLVPSLTLQANVTLTPTALLEILAAASLSANVALTAGGQLVLAAALALETQSQFSVALFRSMVLSLNLPASAEIQTDLQRQIALTLALDAAADLQRGLDLMIAGSVSLTGQATTTTSASFDLVAALTVEAMAVLAAAGAFPVTPARAILIALAELGPIALRLAETGPVTIPLQQAATVVTIPLEAETVVTIPLQQAAALIPIPFAGDNAMALETNFEFFRGEPVTLEGSFPVPPTPAVATTTTRFLAKREWTKDSPAEIDETVEITDPTPGANVVCWSLRLDHERSNRIREGTLPFEISYVSTDASINGRLLSYGTITVGRRLRPS
jgi:hypothetical protein